MDLVSDPKVYNMTVPSSELVQKSGETEGDYIKRLQLSAENQCIDMQDLRTVNAIMTEALGKTGGVSVETLGRDLQQTSERLDLAKSEKVKFETNVRIYQNLNERFESVMDMQINLVNSISRVEESEEELSLVQVRNAEARKEKEAKVNCLLVCIGEEQTKSEKLSDRLLELNQDVDKLLEGTGDDVEFPEEDEDNEENDGIPQEVEEPEDFSRYFQKTGEDSELPHESEEDEVEENGDDSELLQESEEIEDDSELLQESEEKEENEEIEDDSEVLQESEEVEDEENGDEENEDEENEDGENEDGENEDEENGDESELLQEREENEEEEAEISEESKEDEKYVSNGDSSVEHLLDCIRNGKQYNRISAVSKFININNSDAVLEFLALDGLHVLMSVLKEHRDDYDLAFNTLAAISNACHNKKEEETYQQALTNFDWLLRDVDSISLILSFVEIDENFVDFMSIRLLINLFNIPPNRLSETILAIPRAITKLMDIDKLKNPRINARTLELVNYLADQSEEIQQTMVSEGVFENIFSILKENGVSDRGVTQECFRLLNILLRKNEANQKLLRETLGFSTLSSALKLQEMSDGFGGQMERNVLFGIETINILITEDSENDSSSLTNKMALVQENILDRLLMLGVEIQESPATVRSAALRCIGDLICGHPKNVASKVIGEKPIEVALNSILRFIFKTSSTQEFVAADYIFKRFFEKNSDRQEMWAPTLASVEDNANISFGSILLHGFRDLETSCRAASVLSHILEGNDQLKKTVLGIKLEAEPIMQRIVKHLTLASFVRVKDREEESNKTVNSYFGPILSKLLVIWLDKCPEAVSSFIESSPGLTYLLKSLSNESESEYTKGLASVILGQCVIYNEATEGPKDSFAVVRRIGQKIGFESYFLKLDQLDKTDLFASANDSVKPDEQNKEDNVVISSIFDTAFVTLVKKLESDIRVKLVELNGQKRNEPLVRAELEQTSQENETEYINRLKDFVEKQCTEIQDILASNAIMASDLKNTGGVAIETLVRDLHEKSRELKLVKSEKDKVQLEAFVSRKLSDSDKLLTAMNSIQSKMVDHQVLMARSEIPDVEAIKAESKADSLTIWLGYEQRKVEKLRARLLELGENVDKLLQDEGTY